MQERQTQISYYSSGDNDIPTNFEYSERFYCFKWKRLITTRDNKSSVPSDQLGQHKRGKYYLRNISHFVSKLI